MIPGKAAIKDPRCAGAWQWAGPVVTPNGERTLTMRSHGHIDGKTPRC